MNLSCGLYGIKSLNSYMFVVAKCRFGTKKVACAWCTNTKCTSYNTCALDKFVSKHDGRICGSWRMDIP